MFVLNGIKAFLKYKPSDIHFKTHIFAILRQQENMKQKKREK